MSIFEDFTKFLETTLDDFLQSNPQLNLMIMAQEVKQQKQESFTLLKKFELEQKKIESDIIQLGQEIKIWCDRIEKAEKVGRYDLKAEAEERRNLLLTKGNNLWQTMEAVKQKIVVNKQLLISLDEKEKEINLKIEQLKVISQPNNEKSYNYSSPNQDRQYDYLDKKFQDWEVEMELEQMKKGMK